MSTASVAPRRVANRACDSCRRRKAKVSLFHKKIESLITSAASPSYAKYAKCYSGQCHVRSKCYESPMRLGRLLERVKDYIRTFIDYAMIYSATMSTQDAPTVTSEGNNAHLICRKGNAVPRPTDCQPDCLATSPLNHRRRQSLSLEQTPMLAMGLSPRNLAVRRVIPPRQPAHQAIGCRQILWNSHLTRPPYQYMKSPAHTTAPSQWTEVLPHPCCRPSSNGLT